MKIGAASYAFGGIASYLGLGPTLPEKLKAIKALGFDTVELLPVDLENDIEDIKKWLDETPFAPRSHAALCRPEPAASPAS